MKPENIGSSFDSFLDEEGIREEVDRRAATDAPGLFWLSFVRDGKFVGACFVEGIDEPSALTRVEALGIHPGGEVLALKVDPASSKPGAIDAARKHKDTLFRNRAEVEAMLAYAKDSRPS